MANTARKRDREVTRAIHRLYRRADLVDWKALVLWAFTRLPAHVLYDIIIPIQVAYGVQAIVTRQFDQAPHYAWNIFLLAVGYCVLWVVGGLAIIRNAKFGAMYVQRTAFSNYLEKDYEFYSDAYFGALGDQATRLRDALNEYNHVFLNDATRYSIIIGAGVLIIGSHSLLLAGVTLLAMSAVLSYTLLSGAWRLKSRRQLSEANSTLAGMIGDALSHGPTVKSFAAEDYERRHLEPSLREWGHRRWASWATSIPAEAGQAFLAALTICLILIFTARLYQQGSISIAIVTLIQLYVIKMITATQDIAGVIKSYEAAMAAAYHPLKTMMIKPTIVDPARPRKLPKTKDLEISFDTVSYHYPGTAKAVRAVNSFSLNVAPGQKIGLVGYSGSGKTTLTKLLLRFMDVKDGHIQLNAVDIRELAQSELRQQIAYVPQEPLLFHRSIAENIAYGDPKASHKQVLESARLAYVNEFVDELPKGVKTLVGERGVKLSGGQRQRVAIARAILKDAPILVLDEATSALDSRSERYIQDALWHLMKDRTALVIAHRLSTIQRMDRIVVMDKGKIVQTGTHQELLKDKTGIYAELWAHQSGGYIGVPSESEET
jgi:ATP-binding cassette subfamily B protein